MELKNILTQKRLGFIYKAGIFIILVLPVISAPPYFHPADWGKSIAFRIIFSVILFLFLWELVLYPAKREYIISEIKSSKLIWILGAFAFIWSLATIFSLDPYFSFWGSPYRGDGSLNFILYIQFSIFLILNIKNSWQKFWDVSFATGILVSFIGISQKFGLLGNLVKAYGDPPSTMGSSSLLAMYLIMLSFMAISFAIKEKSRKSFFYYFSFIVYLLTINFTSSRSAFLGIVAGALFLVLFYKGRSEGSKLKSRIFWLKISILCFLLLGIISTIFLIANPKILEKMGTNALGRNIYRVANTVKIIYETKNIFPDTRFSGWQIAVKAITKRPLLGWGPENFSIAFDSNFSPEYEKFGKMPWWDRPHNFLLEIAANAGVFALIIYLGLIIFIFWSLQKLENKNPENYIILHGLQAFLIAYSITNLFGFDGASTYMTFFFIVGFCGFLVKKEGLALKETARLENEEGYIKGLFFTTILLLISFLWIYNLKPFLINRDVNWADFYMSQQNYQAAVDKMEKVMDSRSIIDSYAQLKYVTMISDISRDQNKLPFYEKAIEILRETIKIRPYYTRSWYYLGTSLYMLAKMDGNSKLGSDGQLRAESRTSFEKAKQLCPQCESVYYASIRSLLWSDKYEEAKKEAENCVKMFPLSEDCIYLRGLSKIYLNDLKGGKEDIDVAYKKGYPLISYSSQQELLGGYIAQKGKNDTREYYQDLAKIYETLIQGDKTIYQYHASLAFVYARLGKYQSAREQAMEVIKLEPKLKPSVDEFLKTLP